MHTQDQSNFEEFIRTTQIMVDRDFLHDLKAWNEPNGSVYWRLEWPDLSYGGAKIRAIYRDHTVPMRAVGNPRADEFRHFPVVHVTQRLVENVVRRGWVESVKYIVCDYGMDIKHILLGCDSSLLSPLLTNSADDSNVSVAL